MLAFFGQNSSHQLIWGQSPLILCLCQPKQNRFYKFRGILNSQFVTSAKSYSVLWSSTADTHFSEVYISSLNKQCDSNALQCTLDVLVKENLTRPFSACKGQGIDEQKSWVLPAGLEDD